MRRLLAALLLSACAATRYEYREPDWTDTASTLSAIRCALASGDGKSVVDRVMDVRILVRNGYPLNGQYVPPSTIYLNADARSAMTSTLRHEILHRYLHVTTGEPDAGHRSRDWDAFEASFRQAVAECRR